MFDYDQLADFRRQFAQDAAGWARAFGNLRDSGIIDRAIDPQLWQATSANAIDPAEATGRVCFGVAVAMGGIGTAIVACIETEAVPLLQVVDVLPGTGSAPERLRELQERYHAPICIDMRGPSAALADRLRLSLDEWGIARYELVDMRAADAVTAPQAFMSALDQHAVNHAPDSDMDREAGLAGKRMSGDAWLWNRAEGVNAPTIEAATLALWGLTHMPDDTPPGVY